MLLRTVYFLVVLGSLMMFLPYPMWWVLYGCRHKGSQPQDDFLVGLRTGGIAIIVTGVILLFFL